MADKAISELTAAKQVTPTDLFVLDQDGVAKKLTGQILKEWLRSICKEDNASVSGSGVTVTDVSVTENADGSVTMVNTLSDGSAETIVVTADENGNPNGLTVNGTAIPVTWNEVLA
jgi:hypothetical protein